MSQTLLLETDASLPLVQLAITNRAGAAVDPPGKEGLTRLTTRLMRRSALGKTAEQVDELFDRMGGSFGPDVGVTSSGFAGSVISRSIPEYCSLVAGVFGAPSLSEQEFERLKQETQDEIIESRDSDRALARSWFRRALFAGHPYGRSVVGTSVSLKNISIEDVKAHYANTTLANNLIFALAGDVDQRRAEDFRAAVLHGLPDGAAHVDTVAEPSALSGRRLLFVDKPQRTQTQILMGGLGTHPRDEDHTALLVANTVFGGTFTARLMQQVRAERGWSYGAYSSLPFDRQRQGFSIWTFPAATDAAACLRLQFELLLDWVQNGITADELSAAKSYLVNSNVFHRDTAAKRMGLLLDETIYDLPPGYHASFADRVGSVTLAEANAAVQRRISTRDILVTVVGTHAEIGIQIEDAIEDLSESATVSYDRDAQSPW